MLRILVLILCLMSTCVADVSLRSGDHEIHSDIHWKYDVRHNSYHGVGGLMCSACNTTVEDVVRSREGPLYCLDCWEVYLFDENLEC